MSQNPISPSGMKTHHWGIVASIVTAAIEGVQAYSGQTVNLADPVVWTQLTSVAWTIIGLIRNTPQGQPIKS